MNIENAKSIRLPKVRGMQESEIIKNLRREREERKKQRGEEIASPEPVESEAQGLSYVEATNNVEKESVGNVEVSRPVPIVHTQSKMRKAFRIMCCCFRPHRVAPDATFTVDK